MSKYQKSIIYKIYDNTNGNVYYGSTYNLLRVRMNGHKGDAKDDTKNCRSKQIILNNDYSYSMVEPYPCNSKQELRARERYWIENFDCINKIVPGRTKQEYYQDNKKEILECKAKYHIINKVKHNKQHREYHTINKEELNKQRREYQAINKVKLNKQSKEYYTKNKEELCKQQMEYYTKNKEEINKKKTIKIVCECGSVICRGHISTHRKSAKHAKLLALVCPPCPQSEPVSSV